MFATTSALLVCICVIFLFHLGNRPFSSPLWYSSFTHNMASFSKLEEASCLCVLCRYFCGHTQWNKRSLCSDFDNIQYNQHVSIIRKHVCMTIVLGWCCVQRLLVALNWSIPMANWWATTQLLIILTSRTFRAVPRSSNTADTNCATPQVLIILTSWTFRPGGLCQLLTRDVLQAVGKDLQF